MLTAQEMREPVDTVLAAMKVNLVLENIFFSGAAAPFCCQ
jgi:hypothetical protein